MDHATLRDILVCGASVYFGYLLELKKRPTAIYGRGWLHGPDGECDKEQHEHRVKRAGIGLQFHKRLC
jgi:hypothetical protein